MICRGKRGKSRHQLSLSPEINILLRFRSRTLFDAVLVQWTMSTCPLVHLSPILLFTMFTCTHVYISKCPHMTRHTSPCPTVCVSTCLFDPLSINARVHIICPLVILSLCHLFNVSAIHMSYCPINCQRIHMPTCPNVR